MRLTLYRMDPAPLESLEVSRSIKRSNVSGCILLTPYMNRCSAPLPLFSADCEAASSGSKRRAPDGGSPAGVADWMIPDGGGECVSDARPWSDRKRLRKGASSPVHSVAKRCMTCFIAFTPGQERCEVISIPRHRHLIQLCNSGARYVRPSALHHLWTMKLIVMASGNAPPAHT